VNADVPENEAAKVRPGDAVEARSPALPGSVFRGKVGAVLPEVSAATRTLKARIELANPGGQLVPGMFATISFASSRGADVLLVPSEAVIQTGTRSVVILAQDGGKFQPVDVELGGEGNGQTEIRNGLTAGQKIVLSGQFLLDSEASLKGSTSRMSDAQPPAATAPVHHGQGKVERIGKDEVTISHGPIPSLQWGDMTMGFKTPPAGLPRNVGVGDHVVFDIRPRQDGTFEIVTISPVADAPAAANDKVMGGVKLPAAPAGAKK
jgi:Cu(I)/Ag(I) efflux system membrane fusion protein